jgi:hypothetical protein
MIELEGSEIEAKDINVDLTFGVPEKSEDSTRIPVVEVYRGAGIDLLKCIADGTQSKESGKARPLAYLEVDADGHMPGGVKVKPIIDNRKILLASVALVMWIGLWISIVWRMYVRLSRVSESNAAKSA